MNISFMYYHKKSSDPSTLGDEPIWNVISIRGNTPCNNEPITTLLAFRKPLLLVHLIKGHYLWSKYISNIGLPPSQNAADLFSMIVHTAAYLQCATWTVQHQYTSRDVCKCIVAETPDLFSPHTVNTIIILLELQPMQLNAAL